MTQPPPPLAFRRMTSRDIQPVLAIERACFPEGSWTEAIFQAELNNPQSTVLLAISRIDSTNTSPNLQSFSSTEAEAEVSSRADTSQTGEEIVAFAVLWEVVGELQINDVAVDPKFRRRGIASALLREACGVAWKRGVTLATLEVRPSNVSAIALYESLGFHSVGRRRGYYEDGEDALLMDAELTAPCGG